jgi:hypothetical protein
MGGTAVSVAAAKETIKDEAGRVIYEVDNDGIVTMYEKSPRDQILSMKQGTREEMQPRVTGITPDRVLAGSFTTLKLEGRNLVGAKVTFSLPEIEVSPYFGTPESLDLSIRIPGTVSAGEVILDVATPIGTAKTSFKVTDLELGGSATSRREEQTFTTVAPVSCPQGMIGVQFDLGGFCIEVDHVTGADFRKAEKTCATTGNRLCLAAEWRYACEQVKSGKLALRNMLGDWEWTGSWESLDSPTESMPFLKAVLLGKADCQTQQALPVGTSEAFSGRCCK